MEPFSAAYLSSLAAGLTQGVISSLARATRQKIAGSPAQEALERSLQAGVVALAAQATTAQPGEEEHLAGIFQDFFHRPAVWVQVSGLLSARSLDQTQLREDFVDAGYDETTLPDLDFDAGLDAFVAAFQIVADGEKELQGIIQLGQLRQQTQTQRELLAEVRKLVAIVQRTQMPLAVDAGALRGPAGQPIYIFAGDHRGSILNVESEIEQSSQSTGGSASAGEQLNESLRPYLEIVVRRSGGLPLGPLDPSGREAAHLALLRVFINVDAGERIWNDNGILRRYTSAIAHTHENDRVIILGDPGSGKSTLFRFISFCLANALLETDGQWPENLAWTEEQIKAPPGEDAETYTAKFAEQLRAGRRERAMFEMGQDNQSREATPEEVTRTWSRAAAIPLLIELRNFAQTDFDPDSPVALWKYVEAQLARDDLAEAIPALKRAAQRGAVLFLFDGVDEVPPGKRPAIWQAIESAGRGAYGGCRWIAACRVLSFVADEAPGGVPFQTLAPLTEDQIDTFVAKWYVALVEVGERSPTQAREMTAQLQAAARRPRLQDVARNPMLLTIMALVQTYYGTLPNERARLYQQCVETLLLRWQRYKEEGQGEMPGLLTDLGTTQQELERLLWEIAWQAHSRAHQLAVDEEVEQATADIPEAEVVEIARQFLGNYTRAEQFIEYTERRAHLLLGRGGISGRVFTFPHRTFQEYLAACQLAADRRLGYRAAELARAGDYWREVLNLAAGTLVFNQNNREKALDAIAQMLPAATPALEDAAAWRCVWLAGEMTEVVGREATLRDPTGRQLLPRLQNQLAVLLREGLLNPVQRAAAGVALGRLGDPREDVACDVPCTVTIPAGPFRMGSDKKDKRSPYYDELAYEDEEPSHEVDLPFDYKIGKYPVTVAQYRLFIEAGGYDPVKSKSYWPGGGLKWLKESGQQAPRYWDDPQWHVDNHPVVGVTWYEAAAYCAWLSATEGRKFRLPDEAMWEKAARGADGRRWSWGNDFDSAKLNSNSGGIGRTSAVGIFPGGRRKVNDADEYIYDCAGNVLEWCGSPGYSEARYPLTLRTYEEDLKLSAGTRALRGGSWVDSDRSTRAAYRLFNDPDVRNDDVGFRVAELLSDPDF